MSSSYIVEPQEGSSKKDDTLILMVNDNGVISVDQETLQNLIVNQSNANVSVVRLGQTENDVAEGNITLTVDPPPPYAVAEANAANTSDPAGLVDPFMEMDPEQLERLETALQSEEAKQIFGENVTAMLDMLTVEEQQNSIRYSIELDHCYTSRFSPSQPKPADPLPDISSSDMDESICIDLNKSIIHTPVQSQISSLNISGSSTNAKQKVTAVPPKIVKQPSSTLTGSRPRRASTATQPLTNTPKSTVSPNSRSNSTQQESKIKDEEEGPEDELFSSSESSESEDSGSDSDFGPRSARRGVRARGGRRGLTTRGGSMAASRRRGSNKHMDSDQVRRLDLEMAAAVSAMKSPEKEEKGDKHGSVKVKKPLIKTLPSKRKDDAPVTASPVNEAPPVEQNVLQTTNQVKANLISANMIKGDMILTKPGQDRNQKVVFVQKQVLMNPNDVKSLGIKKQIIIPKNKLVISQNSKVPMSKEVKTSSPTIVMKSIVPSVQTPAVHQNITPMEVQTELPQSLPNQQKPSANIRIKSIEIKKEKKKVEIVSETQHKSAVETPKPVEAKAPPVAKKVVKKEHRKSDTFVAETLGPALFSTPDIIRRVGSTQEAKISENLASTTSTVSSTTSSHTTVTNIANPNVSIMSSSNPSINEALPAINVANILDEPMETNVSVNDSVNMSTKLNDEASLMPVTLDDDKLADKAAIAELLEPALDTASNSTSKEMPATVEQSNNVKHVVPESSIEGDEQLLATLEMEAAKQLPNDEELLAEALLLQETLGVDLEHTGLDDPPPDISDSILSSSLMDSTPPPVAVPLVQASSERIETPVAPVTPAPAAPPPALVKTEPTIKKEPKEPIQYIRGGRVITLPPIEAPATRSKRLQAKSDNQPIKSEKKPPVLQQQQQQLQPPLQQPKIEPIIIKTERTSRNSAHVSFKNQDMIYDMNDDDDEEEEVNSDSEDDPNRLWCICRQPHNNRFMICCDMCQEWFHGKCVHVTKAMGEQMEHQGIEWVCPNCSKKKNEEGKSKSASRRQRNSTDSVINEQNRNPSGSNTSITADVKPATPGRNPNTSAAVTYCVVCKKEARKSSIYCSDACILAHAEETSTKEKPSSTTPHKVQKVENKPKSKSDIKIIVYDKKTGKVLTGAEAPTAVNLKSWLKEHPNYDVVKPSNFNTIQLGGKTVATIHTQGIKTNKQLQGKSPGQSKMVFTKIAGSKQTILAPSTKKVVLSDSPPVRAVLSPQQRLKQVSIATPSKNPASQVKQTTPKATLSQQQLQQQLHHHTQQKPMATSTPKATLVKKPLEAKPSTSQQKTPQQQRQLQQPQQQQRQQPVQQQQQQAQTVTKTPPPRKAETEPIRLNVRKTLADLLTSRIKEASDLTLSEEEILELALQIELEMFKFFKSTDSKYKAKYRSLVFNIKDTKNLTLFRKIADRSLTPDAVVKLSPDEMASQELAEWREKENKHQLDMIKKNELEMIAQAKSIVVKTHKGEQIIENEGIDANAAVQEIVSALNSGDTISSTVQDNEKPSDESKVTNDHKKREKERDKERRRSRSRDRSSSKRDRSRSKSRHRHKDRDRSKSKKDGKHKDKDRSRDKDRDRDKKKDKDRKDKHKSSHSSRSHNKSSHKDKDKDKDKDKEKDKDKYKIGEDKKDSSRSAITLASDKSIEDRLWRHIEDETTTNTLDGNESDLSDREPSSTVTIKTPDINEELDRDLELKMNESAPRSTCMVSSTMWRGIVHMNDVAHFFATAQNVSGNLKEVVDLLPDRFDVVGRITPSIVWEYIHKMILTETKEILIIKLTATNDEEKIPYITLYSYLNSRNRLAVFGNMPPRIKDFYVMPFSVGAKLPSVLLPIEGPGFEENRQQHLLIGIIIAHKREKRLAELPLNVLGQPAKMIKKEPQLGSDRSFTPPPSSDLLTATTGKDDSSLAQQQDPKSFSVISKIVPELSAKIKIESSSSSDNMQLDDDDEPYSPGEPVNVAIDDEDNALSSSANLKTTPRVKNSSELQRKMEELTRQIEEEKQQIQNISSSFLTDASSTTLPGLGLDPPDSSDVVEPYSPTDVRSFTPPPHGISKLTQPILEKVSNITIPPNLQEILANVKRQESTKVDPYIPSKPGATFLTTVNSAMYQNTERYSPTYTKTARSSSEVQSSPRKENKSTLSSLSDYDIMKKAEEELAALAAASTTATPALSTSAPPSESPGSESLPPGTSFDAPHR